MNEDSGKTKVEISIPTAIIIAGIIIAFAIFISNGMGPGVNIQNNENGGDIAEVAPVKPVDITLRAVDNEDHIRGALDATVKIVVFSDPECPFCKRFHNTMRQVMSDYSKGNKVAWIYRHFPLDVLHSKARKESEALECANELGGVNSFWAYLDRLMDITPSNDQLDLSKLPEIAEFVKLDKAKFQTCLNSGKYADKVERDVKDAMSAGGRGTPYSVIISANGRKFPIDGAFPYESLKESIETALQDK